MDTTFVHIVVCDNQEASTEILAVFERLKDAEKFRAKEINKENIFIHSLPLEKK